MCPLGKPQVRGSWLNRPPEIQKAGITIRSTTLLARILCSSHPPTKTVNFRLHRCPLGNVTSREDRLCGGLARAKSNMYSAFTNLGSCPLCKSGKLWKVNLPQKSTFLSGKPGSMLPRCMCDRGTLSHAVYLLISFRKSTPPQNRQLIL